MSVLTDEDRKILEIIRRHCFDANFNIPISEWKDELSSESEDYVRKILQIHQDELGTIQIMGKDHYRLTLKGVYLLLGLVSALVSLVMQVPFRHVKI